ncbi:baeRF10 domain-containing protein [Nonomuraea sp. NPDC004354]
MITKDTVDRLIRFDSGGLPVLSLYVTVGLDGSDIVRTRLNSLIAQVRPLADDQTLDRRARLSLRQDMERIMDISALGQGTTGSVAVFACSDAGLLETVPLPRKVRDRVVVDQTPYVRPMLAVLDEYHRCCVLIIDREAARAWELYQEEIHEIGKVRGRVLRKPDYAGWAGYAEYRVRNKADDLAKRHYRQTVNLLDELFRTESYDLLIVGGQSDDVTVFLDFLPHHLRSKVAAVFTVDVSKATVEDIRENAERILADYEREDEIRRVQEVFERAATGGNAAITIDDCLWGGTVAAVDYLLVQDGAEVPGVVCEKSGWLARSGETCPLCGGPTRRSPDVLEDLAETVIDEGGSVEHVTADTRLKNHTAAAALRFPLPPRP